MSKTRWRFVVAEFALVLLFLGGAIHLQNRNAPGDLARRRDLSFAFLACSAILVWLNARAKAKRR